MRGSKKPAMHQWLVDCRCQVCCHATGNPPRCSPAAYSFFYAGKDIRLSELEQREDVQLLLQLRVPSHGEVVI